jgi:hypothetical protein
MHFSLVYRDAITGNKDFSLFPSPLIYDPESDLHIHAYCQLKGFVFDYDTRNRFLSQRNRAIRLPEFG